MIILLIAGFSNGEIRDHLVFKKSSIFFRTLIRIFKMPSRVGQFRDHAPWVTNIIRELGKNENIELHVAGPHIRLAKQIEEFQLHGVYYHMFRSEFSSFARLIGNYKIWKHLQRSTHYTKVILDRVHPDLVILSGAENPTTSVSILSSDKYPRLCLCQTVFNDPNIPKGNRQSKLKADMEKDIFNNVNNIGVYCSKHYQLLKELNYQGHIYRFNYPPANNIQYDPTIKKEYDFVNFALNHGSLKGTQDSIQALALLRNEYPNITLNIVGGVSAELRQELDSLIKRLNVTSNIIFTPLFEQQIDLFHHVQKSRFAILPCKNDFTSGTMTQSMMLGLPLIVYKTAGTPLYNADHECVLIAENGDVNGLYEHMKTLLSIPAKANILRENAMQYINKKNNTNLQNWEKMVNNFQLIIDDYRNNTSIATE